MDEFSIRRTISLERIRCFLIHLQEQERAPATIQKYARDLAACSAFLAGREVTRGLLISWKTSLSESYSVASINGLLAAVNGFMDFFGWFDLKVKPLKIQRQIFCDSGRELSKTEYLRLVTAARRKGNERLSLVLQTICATGIRVSELRFITAEAVQVGRAVVNNKGKCRMVFLPERLRKALKLYLKQQKRTAGPVFVTKTGKPLDRSNIWRDMKKICESAGVEPGKVFPHNLRHLFARTFYTVERDLSRLADILGHSNIATTRIYTMESGAVHEKQINRIGCILTT